MANFDKIPELKSLIADFDRFAIRILILLFLLFGMFLIRDLTSHSHSSPAMTTTRGSPKLLAALNRHSSSPIIEDELTITFSLEIPKNDLDQPDIECEMMELIKVRWVHEIRFGCTNFALALINREYQSSAKTLASIPTATDETKLIVNGVLVINSTMMISIVTYNVTNLLDDETPEGAYAYNVIWNKQDDEIVCNGPNICQDPEYFEEAKQDVLWRKEIFGLDSSNLNGILTKEKAAELYVVEAIESEFNEEGSMAVKKVNVLEFEENRKIVCLCMKTGMLNGVSFNSADLAEECLEKFNIRKEFRQFFNPPLCYGDN